MTEDDYRQEFIELLPELSAFRASLVAELDRVVGTATIEVRSRIKSWEALREKALRQHITHISSIPDLVGIRVIVPNASALDEVTHVVCEELFVTARETLHLREGESSAYILARSKSSLSAGVSAEIQILTAAEEARRALEHELSYRLPRKRPSAADAANDATRSLVDLLDEFESLIQQPNVHEKRDVHPYLRAHTFILYQSADAVISEVPIGLGTEHRIDFLVRRPDGTYLLIEIENPKAQIVIQSGDFSGSVNHALCQVEDWQEWIEANLPVVEKYYPGIRSPEAWVIIGRDCDLEGPGRRRLARRNVNMRGRVTIKTYDDLLRDTKAYIRSISQALGRPDSGA